MDKQFCIDDLTCNYIKEPIGLDSWPYFSWKLFSPTRGQHQTAYRITVSATEQGLKQGVFVWDSDKMNSSDNLHIKYEGSPLLPRTRYFWKVTAYDMDSTPIESAPSYFETGKLNEKWRANWITADYIKNEASAFTAPYLRTTFELNAAPLDARLYICGLGYFEAYINGIKPSDDHLSTAFTRYDATSLYLTYDITALLSQGKNALGVILGNGWYNCFSEDPWNTRQATWRHLPKVIAELHIRLSDNSTMIITTNNTWKSLKSPITFNGIRNGEYYDARLETPNWNSPDIDDTSWETTKIVRAPGGLLKSFELEPIRIKKEITPVRKWKTADDKWILDMGQNFSGIVRLKAEGKVGNEIVIRYCDVLKEDNTLNMPSIGNFIKSGEFQTDKYIKRSDFLEIWQPKFVYHGFQYVELSGLDYEPELDAVTGLVMYTDFAQRGHFSCSNELINKIQNLCYWSTISNYHSIPTDCPHREKNGWTGDASASAEQTLLNFAPMVAYRKWLNDFIDSQKPNGAVPCVVPSTGWGYNWGNGPDWSSALVQIPWHIYTYCADKFILEEIYEAIKKNCSFMESMADDYIVNYGIGDWCAPFEGPALSVNMSAFKAPTVLTDTAYFYNAAVILTKIAIVLGKKEDLETHNLLAQNIRKAFRNKFFNKDEMTVAGNCQTSTAIMLFYGLADEDEKEGLLSTLLKLIENNDNHLDFGILGIKPVMHTLGESGNASLGLKIITQKTFPSFSNWIDKGATTLWECWNGTGSHNHHMFSDISSFLYKYIGGIAPDENEPGFKHIVLRPALDTNLTFVECRHESMYGQIACNFTKKDNSTALSLSLPVGTYATLFLPIKYKGKVFDGVEKIEDSSDVDISTDEKSLIITLRSGNYTLTCGL